MVMYLRQTNLSLIKVFMYLICLRWTNLLKEKNIMYLRWTIVILKKKNTVCIYLRWIHPYSKSANLIFNGLDLNYELVHSLPNFPL